MSFPAAALPGKDLKTAEGAVRHVPLPNKNWGSFFMNSMISLRLAAAALCGSALVACDSIRDVEGTGPTYPVPAQTVVINGTITGLASTRPVVLEDVASARCRPAGAPTVYTGPLENCSFSVQGTETLRLGSIALGTAYDFRVRTQPFGKICTVANGAGVANAEVNNVAVSCVTDPSVPRYTLTATINAAVANASPFPAGFKVTLTTEDGSESISPAPGQTSVLFSLPIMNSLDNLPQFAWRVSATTQEAGGPVNKCAVSNFTNESTAGTTVPVGNVPGGAVLAPTVTACKFTITGNVGYSQPPHLAYTAQTISGLQLGLKSSLTGEILETLDIASFTPATAATFSNYAFAPKDSNSSALYEVAITRQPTSGQFCTVSNAGLANLTSLPRWVAGVVVTPATNPANASHTVRCRNTPVLANQLTGTYQLVGTRLTTTTTAATPAAPAPPTGTITTVTEVSTGTLDFHAVGGTTTRTSAVTTPTGGSPGSPVETISDQAATPVPNNRRFLTFFADGTFLYGTHASTAAASGVEHGFYFYDQATATIYFTITTDSNNGTAAAPNSSANSGLSGTPGPYAVGGVNHPTMTSVVKIAGARPQITGTFGPGTAPGAATTVNRTNWDLTEPVQSAGQLEGAWVTADSKRVWIYTKANVRPGFHVGVNGAPNLQDVCFAIEDASVASGFYARRGGETGCTPGTYGNIDIPATQAIPSTANPTPLVGFAGRIPGSLTTGGAFPQSPVYFTVAPGSPETLTLQNTLNDVPVGPPVVFTRSTIN